MKSTTDRNKKTLSVSHETVRKKNVSRETNR